MMREPATPGAIPPEYEHVLDQLSGAGRRRVEVMLRWLSARNEPDQTQRSIERFLSELEAGLATRQVGTDAGPRVGPATRSRVRVPETGEKLLHLLLPKETREYLIGDLEEEMRTIIHPKFGPRFAETWYWTQVGLSILSLRARFLGLGALVLLGIAVRSLIF